MSTRKSEGSGPFVAFQGERGAFGEAAVRRLYGRRFRPLPCLTFAETFASVSKGQASACVVPVENTLAGSIHENYDLMLANHLHIQGEAVLRIEHLLLASPGTAFQDIRRVCSHPVALAQCDRFFKNHPGIEKQQFYDTAGAVKMVTGQKLDDTAAIAGPAAAQVYGARILKRNIEDHHNNYTRFLLLSKSEKVDPKADKTSIVFSTKNIPGALFKALSVFALRDINLTKIESRPFRGRVWEYHFYVDFIGSVKEARCQNALRHLAEIADFLRVLGSYPSDRLPA